MIDADLAVLLALDDVDLQDLSFLPETRHGKLVHECRTDFGHNADVDYVEVALRAVKSRA